MCHVVSRVTCFGATCDICYFVATSKARWHVGTLRWTLSVLRCVSLSNGELGLQETRKSTSSIERFHVCRLRIYNAITYEMNCCSHLSVEPRRADIFQIWDPEDPLLFTMREGEGSYAGVHEWTRRMNESTNRYQLMVYHVLRPWLSHHWKNDELACSILGTEVSSKHFLHFATDVFLMYDIFSSSTILL